MDAQPSSAPWLSFIRQHGTLSTTIANVSKTSLGDLRRAGFTIEDVTNREGFRTRVGYRMSGQARPTIAFIAGTGLSVNMEAFRYFALPVAQQMGWNVILIESNSSGEWIARNRRHRRIIVDGHQAGWDLYLTLQAIREDPRWQAVIPELHLVGLSLGGNDAVFAGYFDSLRETKVIDGAIMAWSSPADRYMGLQTIRDLSGVMGVLMRLQLRSILIKGAPVFRHYSQARDLWELFVGQRETDKVLGSLFLDSAQRYFSRFRHHFDGDEPTLPDGLAFDQDLNVATFKKLFMLDHYMKAVRQPVMWVHSRNDPIVPFEHTRSFIEKAGTPKRVGFLGLKHGGHLGYAATYGADWIVATVTRYLSYWGNLDARAYVAPRHSDSGWVEAL